MPSAAIRAQPAAPAVTLRQPCSPRSCQPLCTSFGAAAPRLRMATERHRVSAGLQLSHRSRQQLCPLVGAAALRLWMWMAIKMLLIICALSIQNLEGVPDYTAAGFMFLFLNSVKLVLPCQLPSVNSCTGKMGKAVAEAAVSARLQLSHRSRQSLCPSVGAAVLRPWMATERLSITSALGSQNLEGVPAEPLKLSFPILVNSCTGKMGRAVAEAAVSAGLQLVPVSFSARGVPDGKVEICDREIRIHHPSESEQILLSIIKDYPDVIVVDYTVPHAVNANAELYCKMGLPFVMGTTGGDRQLLHKTVQDTNNYAVISPQMGKQVVAFLAAMEIMAEQFPGAFSGYRLEVMESHQTTKLDISGTAKAVISCFQKLGAQFDLDEVKKVRDPQEQVAFVGVPEEHLSGHAFHMYHLTSPHGQDSLKFKDSVCGGSTYVEGTVAAAMFLYTKIKSGASKKLYDMIDVLREGNMR